MGKYGYKCGFYNCVKGLVIHIITCILLVKNVRYRVIKQCAQNYIKTLETELRQSGSRIFQLYTLPLCPEAGQ